MTSTAVRVGLRVRPLTPKEQLSNCTECLSLIPNEPQILIGTDKSFTYDYVFGSETSQQEVYDTAAAPLLKKFMDGFNATILAYGQTGSGKTYSMGTGLQNGVSPGNEGIVPRCIMDLFKTMQEREKENPEYKYEIYVSFLELYNEELVDLLNPQTAQRRKSVAGLNSTGSTEITIREDVAGNIYWSGVREERCYSPEDLLGYLAKGSLCRTTGSTDMNTVSSRSHAIFSVILKQQQPAGSGENGDSKPKSLTSKFHFVDLAGSERLKRTNAQGDRAKEGIAINSGLLALGNVISALGDESRRATHIPYRDSKLTRLLQDSLGGNSQTMMLACVSPADSNFMETLNTLKYANRARNITNRVVINQDFAGNSIEINQLRAQIARLRMEVASLRAERRGDNAGGSSVAAAAAVSDESNKALRAEVSRLRDRIQDMSANLIQVTSERDTLLLERDLNEFMKGESAMDDLTGSSLDQNKQLSTHPLIMQYQKTIQDLNNELQDCKDRIAFLEATKGATMQAVMMANSSLQRSMAHQQQEKQQPSRSNSGTTHHRRRKSHNRRNAGRMSRSNSSTTIHMARRTTGHSAKRQYVKQSASSSVTRQRRQLSVKFQDEEDDYSDDDDIRAEVKSSIAKAREEIQRGMQVLNLIKPLQGLAEEDAWEKELKDFAEAESRQQQSGQESDDTRGSSPDEGSSTAADQDLLGDELLDEIEYLAVPSWDDPVKASSESTVDNEATATDDSSKAAVPQILSQASVVTRKNDPQLARMLHQIQSDIKVKEELVSHLEKSETEYAFMRRKFDDKISQLQQQLLELQQERDGALARTKSRASKMEAAAQLKEKQHLIDIRHSYENKMKGLLAEIQDLKRKYSQTTMNMQATRNQHEALLRSLKVNVETLKLEKKRLLKRIKQETARMREEQTLKERKIQQLQRLNAEANIARKRLEKQHEQQKQALKRRDEEVLINSTQLKQLTEVLKRAVREGGVLDERLLGKVSHIIGGRFALFARGRRGGRLSSRKRKNSIPLHIRVNRKKELLDGALYQYIQGKQAVVEMEELLLRREQLAAEKLELLEERKHMYIAEKEIAEATGHPMDTMALDMTDERIDMIGAEISYLSARIRALQTEALGEAEVADCAAAAAAAAQQQQRLEKRVTFADDILTDTPGPSDDWADMDALEEQYAVPPIAAPEIAYDATMRLLKSLETDEARAIAQALAEDIMTLRMSEANNKAMMQNMEKTVEDLRRTLIVMKRAAITTTVENERRIRKLEERNQKSNSRYSVEDANSIDASVEEYINSGNTIFDKIYEDGIRGVISAPESSLDYLSDSRRSSIVSFGGTSANGSNDEAFIPPPSPLTSPTYVLGQSARAASSNSTVPSSGLKPPVSLLDKNGRGNLYSNREGTPSPERFLKMVQQRRFSWQHRRGSIAESPTPFSTMTPTDFARYEAEVETSTSSIHSNHLRRSSIQSDYSTSSMRKRAYSLQQQQPGRLPDGYDGPLSPPPTATFSVQQQQRWQAPPLPPPRRPRLGPMTVTSSIAMERASSAGNVFDRLAQTPTRASQARMSHRYSIGTADDLKRMERSSNAMSGTYQF